MASPVAAPLRLGLLIAPFLLILGLVLAGRFGFGRAIFDFAETARLVATSVFAWGFLATGLLCVLLMPVCAALLSSTRIGGAEMKRSLSDFDAVAVGFAAVTSIGLFYWAAAEPIYNFNDPARDFGLIARSREAAIMALAGGYLHWGLLAHAVAGIFMVGFGIAVQTIRTAESLDGVVFGAHPAGRRWTATLLDTPVLIFATLMLTAGLASAGIALGARMGEAAQVFGAPLVQAAVIAVLLLFVTIAGARPLWTTYAALARWSLVILILFFLAILILGPTGAILGGGFKALGWSIRYLDSILFYGFREGADAWAEAWTVTHLSGWMLLAPLSGFFMARAARGFTVDDAVLYFVALPALISILCVFMLGGLALAVDRGTDGGVWQYLAGGNASNAVFAALASLEGGGFLRVVFLLLIGLAIATFLAAALHSAIHILAPGIEAQAGVIGNRRAVMLLWVFFIGGCAWLLARFGAGPIVEEVARLGIVPALIVTILVALAAFRYCLLPARALLPRRGETVDLKRYEKTEGWPAEAHDDEAMRDAILKGRPGGRE